jgi:hypothetical protein
MQTYKCPGSGCGHAYPTQHGLSTHMIRCTKYKHCVKQHLGEYKNKLEERPMQLPPQDNQASASGLGGVGGMAPVGDVSHSSSDDIDLNLVTVHTHKLNVGHAADTMLL